MKVRNGLLFVTLAGIGGYWYYNHGLSDEQRLEINEKVQSIREGVQQVVETIKPLVKDAMEQHHSEVDHSNQEATARQWESLGY